jgi:sulfite exporter TauE/SafE
VPLSEDEQRILSEIEQHLYASDPQLVREVSQTTVYRHAGRNLKWAALGFVAGLVFMLATFTASIVLAFAGFLAMLASAIIFERNLRKMGRAGWRQWTETMRTSGVRERFGTVGDRVRDRFKRNDNE